MADSKYPNEIDTDVNLPRVDDGATEISADHINGIRSAIFNIEEALGINPQGNSDDLATRLSTSINQDGTIKGSALSSVGLVTLPITNDQVASNAGIEESKLDLDYTTTDLRTLIAELDVFLTSVNNKLIVDIANLSEHVGHPSSYGRHEIDDIDGTGSFAGQDLQEILTDLSDTLSDHLDSGETNVHNAGNISVNSAGLQITANNLQDAVEQLDRLEQTFLEIHQNNLHSNGIVKFQDVKTKGVGLTEGIKVSSSALNIISKGDRFVQFNAVPSGFTNVSRGDTIEITSGSQIFSFPISLTNSTTGRVDFVGYLPISGGGATARILENTIQQTAFSNLILAKRNANTIQLVHPNAPSILSSKADPRKITSSSNLIKIGWNSVDNTGDINIKTALETYVNAKPSTWSVENVAKALNETFNASAPSPPRNFPLVAFTYNGEIGIAYDRADEDGYVEILTPTGGNSAWSALGFTEGSIAHNFEKHSAYIQGVEILEIYRKILDTGNASGSEITGFTKDVLGLGVKTGDIIRVFGNTNPQNEGTFDVGLVNSTSINFTNSPNFVMENIDFSVYADTFAITSALTKPTLYELFVDAYQEGARLFGAERAIMSSALSSTNDLEQVFDVVDVSRTFSKQNLRLFYNDTNTTLQLGQQALGINITQGGTAVQLPTTGDVAGFKTRVYHNNGIDYVDVVVANSNYLTYTVNNALDIEIVDRISDETFLPVGVVLHNTTEFRHLSDRRLFGTTGRFDVRDDYTRDFITYPRSLLRGNGVIQGFNVVLRADGAIDAYGGEVLNNGSVKSVDTRTFVMPAENDTGTTTYNLFIDENGTYKFLKNDQSVGTNGSVLISPSLAEILQSKDKTMIAQVDINVSNNVVVPIRDYRRFVSDIDSKIDLMVEENDITHGSFASLSACVNYLNGLGTTSPISRRIKIKGDINLNENVVLGNHVILEGDGFAGSGGAKIIFGSSGGITLGTGNVVRDLVFSRTGTLINGFLTGTNFINCLIENCAFQFDISATADNNAIKATKLQSCVVNNCLFENVDKGFVIGTTLSSDGSKITNNIFNEVWRIVLDISNSLNTSFIGNLITTSSIDTSIDLLRFNNCNNCFCKDNIITSTATSASSGRMISVASSDSIVVQDNILTNSTTSGQGFETGINVSGSGNFDIKMISNSLENFRGVSGNRGISFLGCTNSIIFNNFINNSYNAIIISNNCARININGNILVAGGGVRVFEIEGSVSHLNITGNVFNHGSDTLTDDLFVINPSAGSKILINNNTFIDNHTGSTSYSLIDMSGTGSDYNFTGNQFISTVGGTYSSYPIKNTTITNISFCFNNLRGIDYDSGDGVIDLNGKGIDHLNLGQIYTKTLNMGNALYESPFAYLTENIITDDVGFISTSTTANGKIVDFYIGADILPMGAVISSVKIYYTNSSGTTTDMSFKWLKDLSPSDSIASAVSTSQNATAGTGNQTITLTNTELGTDAIVSDSSTYICRIISNAGSSGKTIRAVQVVYTL